MTKEKAAKLLAAATARKDRAHRHVEQAQRMALQASQNLIAVCRAIEAGVPVEQHEEVMKLAREGT